MLSFWCFVFLGAALGGVLFGGAWIYGIRQSISPPGPAARPASSGLSVSATGSVKSPKATSGLSISGIGSVAPPVAHRRLAKTAATAETVAPQPKTNELGEPLIPFGPQPVFPPSPEEASAIHPALKKEADLVGMSNLEFRKVVVDLARRMKEFESSWRIPDRQAIDTAEVDPKDPQWEEKTKENTKRFNDEMERRRKEDVERAKAYVDDFYKRLSDFHSIYEELSARCPEIPSDPLPVPAAGKVSLVARSLEAQARKCLN